jgi:hypothetical protein
MSPINRDGLIISPVRDAAGTANLDTRSGARCIRPYRKRFKWLEFQSFCFHEPRSGGAVAARSAPLRPSMLSSDSPRSTAWMSRCACQGEDPELYFPIASRGPSAIRSSSEGHLRTMLRTGNVPVLRGQDRARWHQGRNHEGRTERNAFSRAPARRRISRHATDISWARDARPPPARTVGAAAQCGGESMEIAKAAG